MDVREMVLMSVINLIVVALAAIGLVVFWRWLDGRDGRRQTRLDAERLRLDHLNGDGRGDDDGWKDEGEGSWVDSSTRG